MPLTKQINRIHVSKSLHAHRILRIKLFSQLFGWEFLQLKSLWLIIDYYVVHYRYWWPLLSLENKNRFWCLNRFILYFHKIRKNIRTKITKTKNLNAFHSKRCIRSDLDPWLTMFNYLLKKIKLLFWYHSTHLTYLYTGSSDSMDSWIE